MEKLLFFFVITLLLYSCGNSSSPNSQTYKGIVKTVKEIELSQPTNFLSVTATFNVNFLGDKILIHEVIKNKATVAFYKDVVVKVICYSKTDTKLGEVILTPEYEVFPPNSEKKFENHIKNYPNVSKLGLEVIKALPTE